MQNIIRVYEAMEGVSVRRDTKSTGDAAIRIRADAEEQSSAASESAVLSCFNLMHLFRTADIVTTGKTLEGYMAYSLMRPGTI